MVEIAAYQRVLFVRPPPPTRHLRRFESQRRIDERSAAVIGRKT
jgi:hypothetical protein